MPPAPSLRASLLDHPLYTSALYTSALARLEGHPLSLLIPLCTPFDASLLA